MVKRKEIGKLRRLFSYVLVILAVFFVVGIFGNSTKFSEEAGYSETPYGF